MPLTGGKRRSTKRSSSKRRSSKRRSPKQTSWTRKLQAWRKANKHADGSLPTMKSAMKHCKGRTSSKCRKNQGRKVSKKRSSKRRSRRSSSKRRTSKKRTSKKRSSKRRSKKRSSKRRTSKKRSPYTRKLRSYYPEFVGKRFEVFRRPQPVFAPAPAPAKENYPTYIGDRLYGPQTTFYGPQTAQQYELRTGKRVDGRVFGPEPKPAQQQPGILESIGNLIMGSKQQQQSVSQAIAESQKDQATQLAEKKVDLYGILGVTINANDTEIKKAYRKLAMKYHADKQINKSESQKEEAAKIMNDVNMAYRILSDPMTRTAYTSKYQA